MVADKIANEQDKSKNQPDNADIWTVAIIDDEPMLRELLEEMIGDLAIGQSASPMLLLHLKRFQGMQRVEKLENRVTIL